MAMTFMSLVNDILDEIDEGDDPLTSGTFATDTRIEVRRVKNYVNKAYREIFRRKTDWSWARFTQTFVTVAEQANYTLGATTNLQKLHQVYINQRKPMKLLPYTEAKRRYADWEQGLVNGEPHTAYELGGYLYLFPVPSAVYTVNVIASKKFAELSAYGDEPLIPDDHRDCLYWLALAMAKGHDNDLSLEYQRAESIIQQMLAAEDNNHGGHSIIPEDETTEAEQLYGVLLE